jgi:hypothetical protein
MSCSFPFSCTEPIMDRSPDAVDVAILKPTER